MAKMLSLRADKPLRVACGLGMLLLLAAHEKVCPWLRTPAPRDVPDPAQPTAPPSTDSSPAKRAPKRLPHVLPEVAAPRWPTGWTLGPPRATGRPGVADESDPHRDDDSVRPVLVAGPLWGWWQPWTPAGPIVESTATGVVSYVPRDPSIQTSIRPLGPPRFLASRLLLVRAATPA